jgi:hypothetical protein
MDTAVSRLAELVPVAISAMMLFVFAAAGGTIAFLWWRAPRQ